MIRFFITSLFIILGALGSEHSWAGPLGPMTCDTDKCSRVIGGWVCPKEACKPRGEP